MGVYRQISGNYKTKSAAFFRLLTQTITAPKKEIGLSERQTHKQRKDDNE